MSHDHAQPSTDHSQPEHDLEQPTCPARRSMLGCALALGAAQFLGVSNAEAATTGKWTSAGAITTFATGKPKACNCAAAPAALAGTPKVPICTQAPPRTALGATSAWPYLLTPNAQHLKPKANLQFFGEHP